MAQPVCRPNGTPPSRPRSNAARRLVRTLSLLSIASLLAACSTTSSTETKAQCAAWRAITYSSKKDTAVTVKQIRVHNRTGQNLGCWK